MFPDPDSTSGGPPQKDRRRVPRRRKRILLIAGTGFALVAILLLLALGPAFPALARRAALQAAASQGMTGDLRVEGSLFSGFSLHDIALSGGDSPLVSLSLESLAIEYDFPALLTRAPEFHWLKRLHLQRAIIDLSLPLPQEVDSSADSESRPTPEAPLDSFSPIWNLLAADIDIGEISIRVKTEEETYEIGSLSLKLPPRFDGAISLGQLTLPGREPIFGLAARIERDERRITLTDLAGKEVETLQSLALSEPEPGDWIVDALLELGGGKLTVSAATTGTAALSLRRGDTIALSELPIEDGPALKGTVSDLDLRFTGDFETPSSWQIDGKILGHGLGVDAFLTDSLAVIIMENRIQLDLLAPGTRLSGTASAPLETVKTTGALATMPVNLSAQWQLDAAETLLKAWGIDLPVTGGLACRAENIQLIGTSLRSGSVLLLSDNLAWEEQPLTLLQVAGNVPAPDRVELAGEAGLDEKTAVNFAATLALEEGTYDGSLEGRFDTAGIAGELLQKSLSPPLSGSGTVRWEGDGTFDPARHRGSAEIKADDFIFDTGKPLQILAAAEYDADRLDLSTLQIRSGEVHLDGTASWQDGRAAVEQLTLSVNDETTARLSGSIPFHPGGGTPLLSQEGEVLLDLAVTDLPVEALARLVSEEAPLAGRLNGQLRTGGTWDALAANGAFAFLPLLEDKIGDPALNLDLQLSGSATRPETWTADFGAILSGLRWNEIQLEDVHFHAATQETRDGKRLAATLRAAQEGATFSADVGLDLSGAATLESLPGRPLDLTAKLEAPELAPLWQQFAPPQWRNIPLAGALSLNLSGAELKGGELLAGEFALFTDSLRIDGENLERIDLTAAVTAPNQLTTELGLHLDPMSRIDGSGAFHFATQDYRADLDLALDLESEGVLHRLLAKREIARLLPETLTLSLQGSGNAKNGKTGGEFDLSGGGLTLADGAEPINRFSLAGDFTDGSLDTELAFESRPLDLDGRIQWDGNRVNIPSLTATTGGAPMFSAKGSLPLTKETLTPETWFAQEEALDFTLESEPVALKTLLRLIKDAPPVNGDLDLDLALGGTPRQPDLDLTLVLAGIALPDQNDLKVGALDLALAAREGKARLTGEYRHPDVNPFTIRASLPFFPKELALQERKITEESLTLSARMEESPLGFLTTQVPAIRAIEGTIALDAEVSGTLKAPLISGTGMLDVSRLRLANRDAPSFYDIDVKTRFAENRLVLERFKAIVAGGEVAADGSVLFVPETGPRLDLRLGARDALIFRTPDLSLRTDAALTLTGPWSAATIAGDVGITNSRFFKNFDLLPRTLPVRNTSVLPTVERTPRGGGTAYTDLNFGIELAPFRDWNADVRLFTKTPFQVRSNLVESDLAADFQITGKLAAPRPRGFLAINEGELSLPFSSVDVEIGRIEFDEQTGFNGALNFKAKARADKYSINVFLYNRILDPKYVLTSNPPMPTEDLVTLLITGTTRDALIGEDVGSVAASKAATLLFKNMRKADAAADSGPTVLDELQERTELDIGGINPETGVQTVGGKIRLWKQLFFVGDVDAENDYRALLKYVFRFR